MVDEEMQRSDLDIEFPLSALTISALQESGQRADASGLETLDFQCRPQHLSLAPRSSYATYALLGFKLDRELASRGAIGTFSAR